MRRYINQLQHDMRSQAFWRGVVRGGVQGCVASVALAWLVVGANYTVPDAWQFMDFDTVHRLTSFLFFQVCGPLSLCLSLAWLLSVFGNR